MSSHLIRSVLIVLHCDIQMCAALLELGVSHNISLSLLLH
jgi:hypothetical protein